MTSVDREVFQLGSFPMVVRAMDDNALGGLPDRFVAMLPAFDLTRLPATLAILPPLLRAGCADLILAGPRADAYLDQVGVVIEQQGLVMEPSAYGDLGDACNAVLFGALMHHAGVALVADQPELLEQLRGIADANGWTPLAATAAEAPSPAMPEPTNAKPTARAKAKARPKTTKPTPKPKRAKVATPKARATSNAKTRSNAKPKTRAKPAARAKAKRARR